MEEGPKHYNTKALVVRPDTSLFGKKFVLSGKDTQGLLEQEVRNAEISGFLTECRTAPACNIIETVFAEFTATAVDFTRCDFKDDVIRSCHFSRCSFTSSSMLFSAVFQTTFDGCSFHDTVVQDCEFHNVIFAGCDFSHIVVKASTFTRCEFRDCVTSNKVFEMCRFGDCSFSNTELQIDTLAENFGITAATYHGTLRDTRKDRDHRHVSVEELKDWLSAAPARVLHKLNVEYFIKGSLLHGSDFLDASLDVAAWAPLFRTAGSFVLALNQWVAFSLWLYERDRLLLHTVICLHSMTGELLKRIDTNPSSQQMLAGVSGAHLALSRIVDRYLLVLEQSRAWRTKTAVFLVQGAGTKEHYYKTLSLFFERSNAAIAKVRPHNSPWELFVKFGSAADIFAFMALFLATRTRIEVSRIVDALGSCNAPAPPKRSRSPKLKNNAIVRSADPLLTLEFGGNLPIGANPSLRLKAYLPGNLVAELKLNIKSQRLAKLRTVIKGLLSAG